MKLYLFPDPGDALSRLQPDSLPTPIVAVPDVHPVNGAPCVSFEIPDSVPNNNGAHLTIEKAGYVPFVLHGILNLDPPHGFFDVDVFRLQKEKVCPDPTPPVPPQPPLPKDPFGIIKAVYAAGHYDLSTKDGCGRFNEDCVTALHQTHSDQWGHIQKFPPQNHYPEQPYVPGGKVHAVDANMLLHDATDGTKAGIYDIVLDSESPNAAPAFNYKGAPDPALWYYPAK